MKAFAQKLRERAEELDLAYAEVARRCGLTERRFGHYVTGTREPDLATLLRICAVLDTTPNNLLGVEHSDEQAESAGERLRASIGAASKSLSVPNLRIAKVLIDTMIVEQRANKGGAKRRG